MAWQSFDTVGAPGMGGGWFGGGSAGGAFLGGLAGGLVGDLFWPGGRRGGCGDGYGDGGYGRRGGETIVQVNENGGRRNGAIADWEIMKEVSDTRYDLSNQNYEAIIANLNAQAGTNAHLGALQMQICQSSNTTDRAILEGQYKGLLQTAGLSREMAECCCKQLTETMKMGFETQLRDQAQFGATMKELAEVKCLITDTAQKTELREAYAKIAQLERVNLAQDIKETVTCGPRKVEIKEDFVRPLTPQYIPYYPAHAVPQRSECGGAGFFNNNWGLQ